MRESKVLLRIYTDSQYDNVSKMSYESPSVKKTNLRLNSELLLIYSEFYVRLTPYIYYIRYRFIQRIYII